MRVTKVISGGQTGADQGGLDGAMATGVPVGGWCPQGRLSEAGPIPRRYPLLECGAAAYPVRTRLNVRDADGTLVFTHGPPRGGTRLTWRLAVEMGKPVKLVFLDQSQSVTETAEWLARHEVRVLNVAGPRESRSPGVRAQVERFVRELLEHARRPAAAGGGA